MQTLATLSKPGKHGSKFIWTFNKDESGYFASNNHGKRITCFSREDMRRFYAHMLEYGFLPPAE